MTVPRPASGAGTALRSQLGSLAFVGNATMLLRLVGLTILTDPNFVPRGTSVPLGYGLSTTRLTDPSMTFDELPPVDAVLLSHYHGDHFDQLVEERLERMTPIVTTPEAANILGDRGFQRVTPLETWATQDIEGDEGRIRITALPGRHAPGPLDVALPDVMGSLIEVWRRADHEPVVGAAPSGPDLRMYVTGDTIFYEGLSEITERAGTIDLAVLHLGGTRVLGVTVTMDAEQGVRLLETVRPGRAAAIHYDDYEAFKSPIADFVAGAEKAGFGDQVRVLERGETIPL
jgi:L-ascorbate metabolism protein UlaG (beta-lactamase superfamily)